MPCARPARVQVDKNELDEATGERSLERQQQQLPSAVFNTWYGKWAGGDKQVTKFRSPYRCNVASDSGYTKSEGPYFCIWFARGACYKGSSCESLHRIPRRSDVHLINNATDCFGRTKHASYRDDMAGVGSLLEENRTLFVGYFGQDHGSYVKVDDIRSQFFEWGNVEQVRLGKNNSIAFVTYDLEISAQFAKEAMSNQTITGRETLVVRWSREDVHARRKGQSNTAPIGFKEEDRIRKIVKTVLQSRREANERQVTESGSTNQPVSTASNGPLSAEAASRIQQLKKRKLESNAKSDPVEQQQKQPVSESSLPIPKKRGIVDYD